MSMQQIISPSTHFFCAFCRHHLNWHTEGESTKVGACNNGPQYHSCKCKNFCSGYRGVGDGLTCECGGKVFDHADIRTKIELKLNASKAHLIPTSHANATIYEVNTRVWTLCCKWTIYHFMATHVQTPTVEDFPVGMVIECVNEDCKKHLAVVESTFVLGPSWDYTEKKEGK